MNLPINARILQGSLLNAISVEILYLKMENNVIMEIRQDVLIAPKIEDIFVKVNSRVFLIAPVFVEMDFG